MAGFTCRLCPESPRQELTCSHVCVSFSSVLITIRLFAVSSTQQCSGFTDSVGTKTKLLISRDHSETVLLGVFSTKSLASLLSVSI